LVEQFLKHTSDVVCSRVLKLLVLMLKLPLLNGNIKSESPLESNVVTIHGLLDISFYDWEKKWEWM